MQLEWSGDVDLNDGTLGQSYSKYRNRLQRIDSFGVGTRADTRSLLPVFTSEITEDLQFVQMVTKAYAWSFAQCFLWHVWFLQF